jgi:hypothetical protein
MSSLRTSFPRFLAIAILGDLLLLLLRPARR